MVGEAQERKLYNAASKGDVTTLVCLLEEDPYLVHGVSFPCSRNLLHIAAMHGQTSIIEEVLKLNPQLACNSDSQESSPLHIAAARGHVEISSKLLAVAPEMCWWRDKQGMNPIHVAAMNGHVEILEHLLKYSCFPALERLHRGQTVLHLCVKHGQLGALKVLVEKLGDLVCAKDDDEETLLHLAVRCNQHETIQYLVENQAVEKQTRNSMGKTALQILKEGPPTTAVTYSIMKNLLINQPTELFMEVLPKMSDVTIVVVILIATMAYQGAVSPPGGVWQDDTSSHRAGEAVLATTNPKVYRYMVRANTTAFVLSLITIFLITAGLPAMHVFFMAVALYAMWMALVAITISYVMSVDVIAPNQRMHSVGNMIILMVVGAMNMFGCIFVSVAVGHLHQSWKKKKRRQQDLGGDAFIRRVFCWIFHRFETGGVFESRPLI